MDETGIYEAQGFGQSTGIGRSPALLLVDFVNGFVDPEVFGGGNIAEAARAAVPVLRLFRDRGLPVIFTRIVYAEDGSDAGLWCEKVPRLRSLTETAHDSQVIDILAPRPGEAVIRKTQASAFFDTGLAALLTHRGIDSLVVAGCTTSGCVRATVIDAISHNFRTLAVADAIGDRAAGPHRANLFDIGQKYADLVEASQLSRLIDARSPAS